MLSAPRFVEAKFAQEKPDSTQCKTPLIRAGSANLLGVERRDAAYGPSDVARNPGSQVATARGQNRFPVLALDRRGLTVRAASLLNIKLPQIVPIGNGPVPGDVSPNRKSTHA